MIAARPLLDRFVGLMQVANAFYRSNPNNPPKRMDITQGDVQQLFRSLNRHQVRYLLVGGMANIVHGYVRATEDLDLWIQVGDENKTNLILALAENGVAGAEYLRNVPLLFGWSSVAVGKHGFTLDMGHALKAFADTEFDVCYARAREASFDDVPFKVIHLQDHITEKQATGRLKDLGDVDELKKIIKSSEAPASE
jgi:predicted nucleotidyltransferase